MGLRLRFRPCPRCPWPALPDPVSNAIRWRRSGDHAQPHGGATNRRRRRPRVRRPCLPGLGELRVFRDSRRGADRAAAGPLRCARPGADLSRTVGLKALGLAMLGVVALLVPVIAPDPATTNVAVFTMMYIGL